MKIHRDKDDDFIGIELEGLVDVLLICLFAATVVVAGLAFVAYLPFLSQ